MLPALRSSLLIQIRLPRVSDSYRHQRKREVEFCTQRRALTVSGESLFKRVDENTE